jgi:hypothetical protein
MFGSDPMSTKLHGITLEDHDLNTAVRRFVPTVLTPTLTKSHSVRTASAMAMFNSTSSSTVGNFKLYYICSVTYPLQSVVALWPPAGLHSTSVSGL